MITITLVGDGSSDKTLLKVIRWAIGQKLPEEPVDAKFAEFQSLPGKTGALSEKIRNALIY